MNSLSEVVRAVGWLVVLGLMVAVGGMVLDRVVATTRRVVL